MNTGGFLLLTVIFAFLLLIVQRSERKRRRASFIIMFSVGVIIWRYGIYALSRECGAAWRAICQTTVMQRATEAYATQTTFYALLAAVVVNIVYWALLGRYNPVGSSDSITVYGRDGLPEIPKRERRRLQAEAAEQVEL